MEIESNHSVIILLLLKRKLIVLPRTIVMLSKHAFAVSKIANMIN